MKCNTVVEIEDERGVLLKNGRVTPDDNIANIEHYFSQKFYLEQLYITRWAKETSPMIRYEGTAFLKGNDKIQFQFNAKSGYLYYVRDSHMGSFVKGQELIHHPKVKAQRL